MKDIFISENLKGKQLNELLLFVSKKSNKLSLARYYYGKATQEEFNQMQFEYKSLIIEEDKKRRMNYKENINGYKDRIDSFCGTEMGAEKYFNDLLNQDIENCNSLNYEEFKDEKYEHYKETTTDFLYTKSTRNTPVTRGPVFEMCFFTIGSTYRKLLSNINTLFEYPYQIEGSEFEDLTFYKGERIVLAICSHEDFAYMNLEDKEYEELLKLNISHQVK